MYSACDQHMAHTLVSMMNTHIPQVSFCQAHLWLADADKIWNAEETSTFKSDLVSKVVVQILFLFMCWNNDLNPLFHKSAWLARIFIFVTGIKSPEKTKNTVLLCHFSTVFWPLKAL